MPSPGERIESRVGHAEALIEVECELTGRYVAVRIVERDSVGREATALLDYKTALRLAEAIKNEAAKTLMGRAHAPE